MRKVTNYNTILLLMRPAPIFLFDLDGTLVDTAPDLLATMNTLLAREGRSGVDAAQLRRFVGRGSRNLIADAFKATGEPVSTERIEPLYADFLADYGSHIARASRPYPDVMTTLAALKDEGVRMGVLTNKPHTNALQLLGDLGMDGLFGTICGQGKYPWLKPDPRLFAAVLAELGGPGGGVLMIGDSITDVETARGGGAPVILMGYGYTPEPVTTLGADLVLDDFADVPTAGRRLLGIS